MIFEFSKVVKISIVASWYINRFESKMTAIVRRNLCYQLQDISGRNFGFRAKLGGGGIRFFQHDKCQLQGFNFNLFNPFDNNVYRIHPSYLLTPWCRVLPEQLTGLQLVKKFPAFHGTRRFITALTSVRHPSLSWASPIQSTCPHPTSWRSILILSTHLHLGLPIGLFPSGFPITYS